MKREIPPLLRTLKETKFQGRKNKHTQKYHVCVFFLSLTNCFLIFAMTVMTTFDNKYIFWRVPLIACGPLYNIVFFKTVYSFIALVNIS